MAKLYSHLSHELVFKGTLYVNANTKEEARKVAEEELVRVFGEKLPSLLTGIFTMNVYQMNSIDAPPDKYLFTCHYEYRRESKGNNLPVDMLKEIR